MDADLFRECRFVLTHYAARGLGGDGGAAEMTPARGGFSGALVFRVDINGNPWCLRRWPAGECPLPRLGELHRWLRFLRAESQIPLAAPVFADNGETLVRCGEHDWQLEPWLPGAADFRENQTEARLTSAMRRLAELHRRSESYRCRAPAREWFHRRVGPSPSVGERLRLLDDCDADSLAGLNAHLHALLGATAGRPLVVAAIEVLQQVRIAAPTVRKALRQVEFAAAPLFPCLRDVWHDHILFRGEEVTGIIDPSAAKTETVATDLSRLLGSLVGNDPQRWRFALDSYERARPLTPDERRLIPVLDASGLLLSGMTWVRRIADGAAGGDPRVLQRLEEIRGRLAGVEG